MNAGKYNKKIKIVKIVPKIVDGDIKEDEEEVLTCYANVKTLKGYTLLTLNSDFECAYTNFTIRYSKNVLKAHYESEDCNRKLHIRFKAKLFCVDYVNNINEENVELELQAKAVTK